MANQYGLIGYPLEHSFSPAFFREKWERESIDAHYEAFPLAQMDDLPQLLRQHPGLHGLNVTAPYKTAVIPYLHSLSEDARSLGSVNCILIQDGQLHGFNTDWQAFLDSLPLLSPHNSALILGNGGAARAIRFGLGKIQVDAKLVCRQANFCDYSFDSLEGTDLATFELIVNATTLGTLNQGKPALPYDALQSHQILYDLVYNPPLTPFLNEGLRRGLFVKNGLEMLQRQALLSWEIWQAGARQ